MYAAGRRDRRQLDRVQRRAAANRRLGHDHAYLIVASPYLARMFAVLALAGGAAWAWFNVDHHRISLVVAGLGMVCALAYTVWFARAGNAHARMMKRAQGEILTAPIWWHLVAVSSVLLFAAAYLIYQP
jgi:hypothetical protein